MTTNFQDRLAAIKARADAAAKTATDYTQTTPGGSGEALPPAAAGPCRLRFVSYVELGQHETSYQGQKKRSELVRLGFEVSGPKHPPREVDGKKFPHMIYMEEALSRNEKANFVKLFNLLNYAGTATHPLQLLGSAYLGTIYHRKWRKRTDPAEPDKWTGIDIALRSKASGYSLRPPRFEDPETGDLRVVNVAEPTSPVFFFLWNDPDEQQWADIFIAGEWPERKDEDGKVTVPARSKNFIQAKIIRAMNFAGSPIHQQLVAGGKAFDFAANAAEHDAPSEEGTQTSATPADDPLAGVAATTPPRGKAPDLMGDPD